ncbi:MAG: hypothetical protein RIS35_114 [Pseudomonadota bacterium]
MASLATPQPHPMLTIDKRGAVAKLAKQSINAFGKAWNHLGSYADVDQALLFGASTEAREARSRFRR